MSKSAIYSIILCSVLLFNSAEFTAVHAQKRIIDSIQLSVNTGVQSILCDSFSMLNQLDYVNAIDTKNNSVFLEIGLEFNWAKKFHTSFNMMLIDSYFLHNFSFKTSYIPFKNFGISVGYYSFDYFLEYYERYYQLIYSNYTLFDDDGFLQRRNTEQAFVIGPVFRVSKNKFALCLNLQGGFIKNNAFTDNITLKLNNSNFIQQHRLQVVPRKTPVFFPDIEICYFFGKTKSPKYGIHFTGNLLIQDKSIDYNQTIYRWTIDNYESIQIFNVKHRFIKYELSLGFSMIW